jgi:hypothetical protein
MAIYAVALAGIVDFPLLWPTSHNSISSVPSPPQRRLELQAMSRKLKHWGYYVMATRELAYPPSWRWQIVRRGKHRWACGSMAVALPPMRRRDLRAAGSTSTAPSSIAENSLSNRIVLFSGSSDSLYRPNFAPAS